MDRREETPQQEAGARVDVCSSSPKSNDMKEKKKNKDKFAKEDDMKNKCHLNVSVKIEEIPEDNIV